MKNRQIINSWNKIEPSRAADERMLAAILARNHSHSGQPKNGTASLVNRTLGWKRLAPLATCLALAVALIGAGVLGNTAGWFGGKPFAADLGNSGTLNFYRNNSLPGAASFARDASWGESIGRDLTEADSRALFGDLPSIGYFMFRSADNAFMHFEGHAGNAKIILSANGFALTDTPIDINARTSDINGIPVAAGYWISGANSKGIRAIIYTASFEHDGVSVYMEVGGEESDGNAFLAEISALVEQFTKNPPDVSAINAMETK
ncbi:MAG: hypothetical protein LBL83_01630 [Clostridiales bacterium]|nr:hypothetical protein [Clostridiales bacterium]